MSNQKNTELTHVIDDLRIKSKQTSRSAWLLIVLIIGVFAVTWFLLMIAAGNLATFIEHSTGFTVDSWDGKTGGRIATYRGDSTPSYDVYDFSSYDLGDGDLAKLITDRNKLHKKSNSNQSKNNFIDKQTKNKIAELQKASKAISEAREKQKLAEDALKKETESKALLETRLQVAQQKLASEIKKKKILEENLKKEALAKERAQLDAKNMEIRNRAEESKRKWKYTVATLARMSAVILAIYLVQLLVGFARFNFRKSFHLSMAADALMLAKNNKETFSYYLDALTGDIDFSSAPRNPVKKIRDTVSSNDKSK